ncbi:hypothetical protein HOK00_09985 [bacterium]|jgi:hypothetical protein|nr:hypothetical protein [bacterium]
MNSKHHTTVLAHLHSKPILFSRFHKDDETLISENFYSKLNRISPNNNTNTILMFSSYGKESFFNFYRYYNSLLNKCYHDNDLFNFHHTSLLDEFYRDDN